MASSYDHEDVQSQSQVDPLGYDPNYVPDSVRTFVVHLYRHIREKNVYEIHQMYESSFQTLSDRLFKETPWPSVDAVAHHVDNDHVFCLLYREMWYRHLYARLSPTAKQRNDSWDNYCSLFQVVLHGVVNMQLPNQWLWDMVDEFVYQFQSFCQYRAKMKNKTEQEIALLRQYDQVLIGFWSTFSLFAEKIWITCLLFCFFLVVFCFEKKKKKTLVGFWENRGDQKKRELICNLRLYILFYFTVQKEKQFDWVQLNLID